MHRLNSCSYSWTKYSGDCITELKWPFIHQRHVYFSVCQVHDTLHHCNFVNQFQLSNASTRSHPLSIQPVQSSINSYHYFLLTVHSYGTVLKSIPYAILGSNSLAHSASPFIIFIYDFCCCN